VIRIARGAEPSALKTAAPRRLNAAAKVFNQQGTSSKAFKRRLTGYNAHTTKAALFCAQYEKCAWCELKTPFKGAPVDHYRPKDGAWRNLPGKKRHVDAGYYWWLTWTWSNLLFACVRCNTGHKANYFPLRSRTAPVAAPVAPLRFPLPSPLADAAIERPLLLDPAGSTDPIDHIDWRPTNKRLDRSNWIWTPVGLTDEGNATIDILQLGELAGRAQEHVRKLLIVIEEVERHLSAGRTADAHRLWKRLLTASLAPTSEMSAFTWRALRYLVRDSYRRQHKLAAPKRPGAP
jgi:hypothetical protein